MKLSVPLVSLAALAPVVAEGYGLGLYTATSPRLFRPMVITPGAYAAAVARNNMANGGLSVPRYEVTDSDEKFQVAVDVPGVQSKDIHVTLEDGILTLRGERTSNSDQYHFSSKFSQSFSLDPAVDVEKFTANLQNGVLIVSAPKDMKRLESNIKSIPVIEGQASSPIIDTRSTLDQTNEKSASDDVGDKQEDVIDLDRSGSKATSVEENYDGTTA